MADALEERLRSHARAFEGLMSLIPAKQYYEQDNSEQWQKTKKQTKQEKKAARIAKLDPDNYKSAKDILDENERKRKRELEGEREGQDGSDNKPQEKPREGMKPLVNRKKQKVDESKKDASDVVEQSTPLDSESIARKAAKEERRKKKEERKKEKEAGKKESKKKPNSHIADTMGAESDNDLDAGEDAIDAVDLSGLVNEALEDDQASASPTPRTQSPASAASAIPSTSSSSSIVPPSTAVNGDKPKKEKLLKLPDVDHEILKARLRARLDALRSARNADGIDGKPARTRQELIEARRRKADQRRAHKKEVRKTREEEERAKFEAELALLRGSGSPLTGSEIFSPRTEELQHNFSFGRVRFDDGQQLDSNLSTFIQPNKKGPQDPHTALEAAQKKQSRLSGLDEAKRANIEEKDLWLNAKKKVHGEKVRDDTSLLKKTLKRKEKTKLKSETEWNERIANVQKGKEIKQKRREGNLRKRRDEKGKGGKKTTKKPKKRPGFEGSFRAKAK